MKTFLEQLTEAKDKFIDKNRNLTPEQKEELKTFFRNNSRAEKEVEDKYKWSKSKNLTYDDFVIVMNNHPSGRKMLAKTSKRVHCQTNLRGLTPNEDYVHLKIKSRDYCAYIPLSYETAKMFNKDKVIGTVQGDWCIGHSSTSQYWNQHCKRRGEVPIYIVGNNSKWVVMIQKNNSSIDIWDIDNKTGGGHIPNVDAKSMFLDSKKKKLYDDIRENFTQRKPKVPKDLEKSSEYKAAVQDWERMADDIESWVGEMKRHEEYHYEEQNKIIPNTVEKYKEMADDAEKEAESEARGGDEGRLYRNYKARVDSFEAILKKKPAGTGTDKATGEAVWHIRGTEPSQKERKERAGYFGQFVANSGEGMPYTRKELQAFIDTFYDKYPNGYIADDKEPDYSERDEYLDIIDLIKDLTPWEVMDDHNGSYYGHVEWTDEFYKYESPDVYTPHADDRNYDDYFEFAEDWGYDFEGEDDRSSMFNGLWEIQSSGWEGVDGESELDNAYVIHPSEIVKKAREA